MGLLSKLVGGSVAEPIEAVGNVLTGIFGDKGEKLSHEQIMAKLAMQPQMLQVELNKVEAAHRSIFVAGWRPALGWVCAIGLGYAFIVEPVLTMFTERTPQSPTDIMLELVLAMLGLGALRTVEKLSGKAK
jgi:hypothetical protein